MNDAVIVAWYDPHTNQRTHVKFDFYGLKAGSGARAARVDEYERFKEALRGQGCKVGVWTLGDWARGYGGEFRDDR